MIPIGKLVLAAVVSVAAVGLWTIVQFAYRQLTSPLRHLRGPKGTNWIFGNLRDKAVSCLILITSDGSLTTCRRRMGRPLKNG